MITVYRKGGIEGSVSDVGRIPVWVDCVKPSEKDLITLSDKTKIPLEDFKELSGDKEKPRLAKRKCWAIVYAGASKSPDYISSHAIFILNNCVISFRKADDIFPSAADLKEHIGNKFELVYQIIRKLTDGFFEELEFIEEEVDRLEVLILEKPDKDVIRRIFSLRKKLLMAHKALKSNKDAIQEIETDRSKFFVPEFTNRLKFVYYDLLQLIDSKDMYREILSDSLEIYVSNVSNSLNSIMKTLTIVTAILMVPTLISGIYGMNFEHMPEIGWKYGYLWSYILMLILILILLWFFRKRGFFRSLE